MTYLYFNWLPNICKLFYFKFIIDYYIDTFIGASKSGDYVQLIIFYGKILNKNSIHQIERIFLLLFLRHLYNH